MSPRSTLTKPTAASPPRRLTAAERRPEVIEAALAEFAVAGLAGASTEAIAQRAGISHAYLFRLFGTKRELFLAAVDRSFDHVLDAFTTAAEAREDDAPLFKALGQSYRRLLQDRKELLFQFHAYAACADEDIRKKVESRYMGLFEWVRRTSGASVDRTRLFMSAGLLITVGAAIGNSSLSPDGSWTNAFTEGGP